MGVMLMGYIVKKLDKVCSSAVSGFT